MRNSFLAAALELRSGIPEGASPKSGGPDVIRALGTSQFLDFLGIRLDTAKAGDAAWTINLITPDNGEQFVVELSNGTLTNLAGLPRRGSRPHHHDQPRRPRGGDDRGPPRCWSR